MVSLLIPTYKRPHLLLRALQSLQGQSNPGWEALVVDDGDGESEAVIASLKDARIKGLRNRGKGQVDARNTALAHAQGHLIGLLDDDDWLLDPHHLELAQQALQQEAALLYRGGYLVQEEEGQVKQTPFQYLATPERMQRDNVILASGLCYPRSFHQHLGPFDSQVNDYWDWDWYLRVLAAGYPLIQLPGLGVAVALHGANMSYGGRIAERQRNLDKLCKKHGLKGVVLKDHGSLGSRE
jgi:glycosyltransferase involved in cell wall biosynthesis